jgi:hypothetical protein
MIRASDDVCMEIALVVFLVLVGVLAAVGGADSRIDDVERRRRYLG